MANSSPSGYNSETLHFRLHVDKNYHFVTDEEQSTKHLRAFQKLEELGFDRLAIHNALIKTQLDHDKALEILLK